MVALVIKMAVLFTLTKQASGVRMPGLTLRADSKSTRKYAKAVSPKKFVAKLVNNSPAKKAPPADVDQQDSMSEAKAAAAQLFTKTPATTPSVSDRAHLLRSAPTRKSSPLSAPAQEEQVVDRFYMNPSRREQEPKERFGAFKQEPERFDIGIPKAEMFYIGTPKAQGLLSSGPLDGASTLLERSWYTTKSPRESDEIFSSRPDSPPSPLDDESDGEDGFATSSANVSYPRTELTDEDDEEATLSEGIGLQSSSALSSSRSTYDDLLALQQENQVLRARVLELERKMAKIYSNFI